MQRYDGPEDRSGYEDPAQRPKDLTPEHQPDYRDPEERHGKWPPATLFIVVLAVLFAGLAILAVLGIVA